LNQDKSNLRPITIFAPGMLAGAERVVITGLKALKEIGLNPKIIVIQEERIPQYADDFLKILNNEIDYSVIKTKSALDIKLPAKISQILKHENGQLILHTHGFKALLMTLIIKKHFPVVHTHHGNTGHTFKVRFYEHLAKLSMRFCQKIILVSKQMEKDFKSFSNTITIDNMLSLKNANEIRLQRQNKKKNSEINLTYIGRLSPEKGIVDFLIYFSNYKNKNYFNITILGDGALRNDIEKLIAQNALQDSVKMVGFITDPTPYLIEADMLIMPSHREGLPMTLIESLASGIPVIANNVGAISSLVQSEFNGYLTSGMTEKSWHQTLDLSLLKFSEWKKNAQDNAQNVELRFSAKTWAERTANVYKDLIARSAT